MVPIKRRVIVDVGSGRGEFTKTLKKRNPNSTVIGIDRDASAKTRLKLSMAEFFLRVKNPQRVKRIWLNHVDIISMPAFREFEHMVRTVPSGTVIMMTVRRERLQQVRHAIKACSRHGVEIRSEKEYSPKIIGSETTKKFYAEATRTRNSEKMPIRIVIIKK